jgi:hypothetical protein
VGEELFHLSLLLFRRHLYFLHFSRQQNQERKELRDGKLIADTASRIRSWIPNTNCLVACAFLSLNALALKVHHPKLEEFESGLAAGVFSVSVATSRETCAASAWVGHSRLGKVAADDSGKAVAAEDIVESGRSHCKGLKWKYPVASIACMLDPLIRSCSTCSAV